MNAHIHTHIQTALLCLYEQHFKTFAQTTYVHRSTYVCNAWSLGGQTVKQELAERVTPPLSCFVDPSPPPQPPRNTRDISTKQHTTACMLCCFTGWRAVWDTDRLWNPHVCRDAASSPYYDQRRKGILTVTTQHWNSNVLVTNCTPADLIHRLAI